MKLDFTTGLQEINLDTLKRTYKETTVSDEPIMGIFHFALVERIMAIAQEHGMDASIKHMFAAQNKKKGQDGVVINPTIQQEFGEGSPESHVLRRVYTTINIENFSDKESSTGLAIAYHQDGIQIAMGPLVRICTNQSILSAERMISTYGDNKIKDFDKIFQIVDDWMHNFEAIRTTDQAIISKMKDYPIYYEQVMELIGRLNASRVVHDTTNKDIRLYAAKNMNEAKNYALNQGQISQFTEGYLLECIKKEQTQMTLWDIYNIATDLYKPGTTDIPNLIPQNVRWAEMLINEFNLN